MLPILKYGTKECMDKLNHIINRSDETFDAIQNDVNEILYNIKNDRDKALIHYIKKFDNKSFTNNDLIIDRDELKKASKRIPKELLETIKLAYDRIYRFHMNEKKNGFMTFHDGETLGQLVTPLNRVGVYVPGGKASYPSSVMMNVIPAKVAGVSEVYLASPGMSDAVMAACYICEVTNVFNMGGVQAIGAFAYGTETVPKVDKITGPGNVYVACAKKTVYGLVGIDAVAGPSEILIIADETANPSFVAADMLSQAEHDEMASSIVVTTSEILAKKIAEELYIQLNRLERKEIAKASLDKNGAIIVTDSLKEAFGISNLIAPEHLEVCTLNPMDKLTMVKNAGAVFLGNYSPEPLGDYMAGTNHVIPTGGAARFSSPLSVDDFVKKTSVISFTENALYSLNDDIVRFAEAEGLSAHGNAVKIRFQTEE